MLIFTTSTVTAYNSVHIIITNIVNTMNLFCNLLKQFIMVLNQIGCFSFTNIYAIIRFVWLWLIRIFFALLSIVKGRSGNLRLIVWSHLIISLEALFTLSYWYKRSRLKTLRHDFLTAISFIFFIYGSKFIFVILILRTI